MERSMILNLYCSIYSDWRKIRAISSGAIDSFRLELEAQRFEALSIRIGRIGSVGGSALNLKSAKTCLHLIEIDNFTTCIIGENHFPIPV